MKCSIILTIMLLVSGNLFCKAESACRDVTVRDSVEAEREELTLADLLEHGTCLALRQSAAGIGLGVSLRAGSERVIDGRRIRELVEGLGGQDTRFTKMRMEIPARVVVRRAGGNKSCVEIAQFVEAATLSQSSEAASLFERKNLDCPAARSVPREASLELVRSTWNPGLRRWEFALRCADAGACVPFLIWTRPQKNSQSSTAAGRDLELWRERANFILSSAEARKEGTNDQAQFVKPGQTVTLTWDQGGIRVTLPVTSLEAGGMGETVRVQLKNAARILRAEVVGDRLVRAEL